jgi:hypothetical protein
MANTNFPPQITKVRNIKGFGEDIGQLSPNVYVSNLNVSLLYVISQEVVSPLKVSHSFVEDCIFGYRDDTGVNTHEGNSLKTHSKVSHGVHNPKDLGATATYSASVVIGQLKIIFEMISKWEKIQENDKSQKCSFGQSHNPRNQYRKNQQDPLKKK